MRLVKRKWGWYWTILDRKHFKVKLLRFSPGKELSIQYHKQRSELWLFLTGDHKGEYWLIKPGDVHTYYADKKAVWMIEVQFGEQCVERDIVRL